MLSLIIIIGLFEFCWLGLRLLIGLVQAKSIKSTVIQFISVVCYFTTIIIFTLSYFTNT